MVPFSGPRCGNKDSFVDIVSMMFFFLSPYFNSSVKGRFMCQLRCIGCSKLLVGIYGEINKMNGVGGHDLLTA